MISNLFYVNKTFGNSYITFKVILKQYNMPKLSNEGYTFNQ